MSVHKRKANNKQGYVYEVRFVYDHFGIKKRYSKSGFTSMGSAKDHETLMKAEFLQQGGNKNNRLTLNEIYEEWLKIARSEFQPSTIAVTQRYYEHQVKNEDLGSMQIQLINYQILQNFFNNREDRGISGNQVFKTALNRIFKYALRCGYITINYLDLVVVNGEEKARETTEDTLTIDQLHVVIHLLKEYKDFNDDAFVVAILLSYYLGLRMSETLALEKQDFNFEKNEVFVHRKLIYQDLKKEEVYAIETMKTKASKAIIPLPEVLKPYLMDWFKENPFERVICDSKGSYVQPRYINQKINRILKRKNYDFHFHFHELRHTYSTNLYNSGVDIKIAQELMRHASFNTTMSVYTHLAKKTKLEVVNSVFSNNDEENRDTNVTRAN